MNTAPLSGIRILELGGYISAPYATSLLCALGAEVVKVERPGGGDDFRRHQGVSSPYFVQYNTGKRSLAVNLKSAEGIALVKALVPTFDVVVENMRPGKMTGLGLGAEVCAELNPRLVYVSVTGFGPDGPLADRAAYDTMGQAAGGLYTIMSDDGRAQLSGTCVADLITGLSTATAVLAALVGRGTTGSGQLVETSLMESISLLTVDAMTQYFDSGHVDPSRQSRHPQAQNFVLRTAGGPDIAVHLSSSQKFWFSFLDAMERPDLRTDPRFTTYGTRTANYFELVPLVEAEFLSRTSDEWETRLTEADVPFAPVLTVSGYAAHPQTQWLGMVDPERNGLSLVRPPWRFDGKRPERAAEAPHVGEHTREIASEVYDDATIDRLIASGILATT